MVTWKQNSTHISAVIVPLKRYAVALVEIEENVGEGNVRMEILYLWIRLYFKVHSTQPLKAVYSFIPTTLPSRHYQQVRPGLNGIAISIRAPNYRGKFTQSFV